MRVPSGQRSVGFPFPDPWPGASVVPQEGRVFLDPHDLENSVPSAFDVVREEAEGFSA